MPTRGPASPRLRETIDGLAAGTAYRTFELVLVAPQGRLTADGVGSPGAGGVRVVEATGPFNFSAWVNHGAAAARGAHLLVMHDDVSPLDPQWLQALLELSAQPGIGAVGAKLYYSHGALQHTGLLLGVNGLAGRPFQGFAGDTAGYFSNANCIRNYSAVGAACLMTRRQVFDRVGGFDERLRRQASDVDYGLKVTGAGWRVVFTPYARLVHHEIGGVSQVPLTEAELSHLRDRWGERLERDPYYNPNLSREHLDYRVEVRGR
jgi:GT2 family glycosyltransferase